jgi:hypothetical protein
MLMTLVGKSPLSVGRLEDIERDKTFRYAAHTHFFPSRRELESRRV